MKNSDFIFFNKIETCHLNNHYSKNKINVAFWDMKVQRCDRICGAKIKYFTKNGLARPINSLKTLYQVYLKFSTNDSAILTCLLMQQN